MMVRAVVRVRVTGSEWVFVMGSVDVGGLPVWVRGAVWDTLVDLVVVGSFEAVNARVVVTRRERVVLTRAVLVGFIDAVMRSERVVVTSGVLVGLRVSVMIFGTTGLYMRAHTDSSPIALFQLGALLIGTSRYLHVSTTDVVKGKYITAACCEPADTLTEHWAYVQSIVGGDNHGPVDAPQSTLKVGTATNRGHPTAASETRAAPRDTIHTTSMVAGFTAAMASPGPSTYGAGTGEAAQGSTDGSVAGVG